MKGKLLTGGLMAWHAPEFDDWGVALFIKKRRELNDAALFQSFSELAGFLTEDKEFHRGQMTPESVVRWLQDLAKGRRYIVGGLVEAVTRAIDKKFSGNKNFCKELHVEFSQLPPVHTSMHDNSLRARSLRTLKLERA